MNVLSLFSGIGGLELGLERAGMTVVGQVEIDPFCRSILAKHWPAVPKHDDVRTAIAWWLAEDRPAVDVVAGGFPCQPFSHAGHRKGVTDERWGWPRMRDVIDAVQPRYVVIENVAALLRDTEAFSIVLSDLSCIGFDAEWDVISACSMGAPHARRRLFVVAHSNCRNGVTRMEPVFHRPWSLSEGHYRQGAWRHRVDWAMEASGSDPRDADGLSVQMVRALGNAVVPQIAEFIGAQLLEAS